MVETGGDEKQRCPRCGHMLEGDDVAECSPRSDYTGSVGGRQEFWAVTPITLGVLALATALGLHELWAFLSSIFLGGLAVGFGAFGMRRGFNPFALTGLVLGAIAAVFMLVVVGIAVAVGDL